MLRRGDYYWDQDIPIEIGKLVKLCKYEHLSIDGSQYAQIIEESEEVIIQIYQVKDNFLPHRLRFPMIKNEFLTATYGFKFSSEYLICNRNLWKPFSSQLYLFNFKINTGKLFFLQQCCINVCFYRQDQFYIFLYEYLIIKIYKVENDFNLILIAIQKEHEEDKTIDLVQNKNPILLILMNKNERNYYFFRINQKQLIKSVIFILMKDMFLKDQQNYSQMIVAQNRNGKRIRKIDVYFSQIYQFPIAILQHYVFICLNSCYLKVYDLKQGLMVGNLNLQGNGQIDDFQVTDDYFTLEINKVNWGWPIRKQK